MLTAGEVARQLTLTDAELREITGGYKRPADQLAFLRARGFERATLHRGRVLLTRAHFEAVEAGRREPERPKVKPPTIRHAHA